MTNSRRDCFSGACYTDPSWAPSGEHIALLSRGRCSSGVDVIRADGGGEGKEFAGGNTEPEGFGSRVGAPGWGPLPR